MKMDSAESYVDLDRLELISAAASIGAAEVMSDPLGRTIAFVC